VSQGGLGGVFPGVPGTKVVLSLKPDPNVLLLPQSDPAYQDLTGALKDLILDGARKSSDGTFAGTAQLTVWHEAGFLYSDENMWGQYNLWRDDVDAEGRDGAQRVRSMHVVMKGLCDEVNATSGYPHVEYGCIIYGDIDKMASNTDMSQNFVPGMAGDLTHHPMDWYGIDVYYEDDGAGSLNTHDGYGTNGLLDSDSAVSGYLGDFAKRVGTRIPSGGSLRINVTETNAGVTNDAARPLFFERLAKWLSNNGGYRMLTFFPDEAVAAADHDHSVTWQHIVNAGTNDNTLVELRSIQSNYG
jgi:hypothetical protein